MSYSSSTLSPSGCRNLGYRNLGYRNLVCQVTGTSFTGTSFTGTWAKLPGLPEPRYRGTSLPEPGLKLPGLPEPGLPEPGLIYYGLAHAAVSAPILIGNRNSTWFSIVFGFQLFSGIRIQLWILCALLYWFPLWKSNFAMRK